MGTIISISHTHSHSDTRVIHVGNNYSLSIMMQITFGGILSLSSYSLKTRTELVDHCLKHHLIALKEPSVSPTIG